MKENSRSEPSEADPSRRAAGWIRNLILVFSLISGGVALSYEVLWTRELLNLVGSTTRASTLVLAGFMGGLALGAWFVGEKTVRSGRALWLFVVAEGLLSFIGLAFPEFIDVLLRQVPGTALLTGLLLASLFAPAALMGVALPALAATLQRLGETRLNYIAVLYGLNTLGGAIAALVVGLGLLPAVGLIASQRIISLIGLVAAFVAAGLALRLSARFPFEPPEQYADIRVTRYKFIGAPLAFAIFLSGAAALGYQVLWTRVLVLVIGSSSNAFTIMLGLYLVGLSLGGVAIGGTIRRGKNLKEIFQWLQLGVAFASVVGAGLIGFLPSFSLFMFAQLGTSPTAIAVVMGFMAMLIILPPTVFIGATFPTATQLLKGRIAQRGREVGAALALTTFGNVVGILLAAFVVIPAIGLQHGIQIFATGNIVAAIIVWLSMRASEKNIKSSQFYVLGAGAAIFVVALFIPGWNAALMTSGVFRQAPVYLKLLGGPDGLHRAFSAYQTLYYQEGREAVVAVYQRPTLQGKGHKVLTIDGKVDASTGADMATQVLSGHLPYLFRPDAKNALVIGLASGVTVGKLAAHPYEMIEVVEIEPAVVEASATFNAESGAPLSNSRVQLSIADGRLFLSRTKKQYDVIVSEPSNPWLSMSARLFTREFFELASARLAPEGILVQWIPLYGLSASQFESLLQTLMEVFPNVELFRVAEGDLIAISSVEPIHLSPQALETLFRGEHRHDLQRLGFNGPSDLLTRWIADARGLNAVLEPGVTNSDDNGYLEFGSPWYLLSDTAQVNLALLEKAFQASNVMEQIAQTQLCQPSGRDLLLDLAGAHLASQHYEAVIQLAEAFRSCSDDASADLLLGDLAQAKGRLTEANAIWEQHVGPAFLLRQARLAFGTGNPEMAAELFSEMPSAAISSEDAIAYAFSLTSIGQTRNALLVLGTTNFAEHSASGIFSSYLKAVFLADLEQPQKAAEQHKDFERRLDGLRRCIEREGCQSDMDDLVNWSKNASSLISPDAGEELQRQIYFRVTRPLGAYMRAVSAIWLGETAAAKNDLKVYLRLLPEADPQSKAHELLASVNQQTSVAGRD